MNSLQNRFTGEACCQEVGISSRPRSSGQAELVHSFRSILFSSFKADLHHCILKVSRSWRTHDETVIAGIYVNPLEHSAFFNFH